MGRVFWALWADIHQRTLQGSLQAQGPPHHPAPPAPPHSDQAQEATHPEAPTGRPARSPNPQRAAAVAMLWLSPRPQTPHASPQVRLKYKWTNLIFATLAHTCNPRQGNTENCLWSNIAWSESCFVDKCLSKLALLVKQDAHTQIFWCHY